MEEFKDLYSVAKYFEVPDSANIAKLIAEMINVGIESEVHLGDYDEFQDLSSSVSSEFLDLSIEEVEDNINKIDFLFGEDYKRLMSYLNTLKKNNFPKCIYKYVLVK